MDTISLLYSCELHLQLFFFFCFDDSCHQLDLSFKPSDSHGIIC